MSLMLQSARKGRGLPERATVQLFFYSVGDLFALLSRVQQAMPCVQGVATGAIL